MKFTLNVLDIGEESGRIGLDYNVNEHRIHVVGTNWRFGDAEQILNGQHAFANAGQFVQGRLVRVETLELHLSGDPRTFLKKCPQFETK